MQSKTTMESLPQVPKVNTTHSKNKKAHYWLKEEGKFGFSLNYLFSSKFFNVLWFIIWSLLLFLLISLFIFIIIIIIISIFMSSDSDKIKSY